MPTQEVPSSAQKRQRLPAEERRQEAVAAVIDLARDHGPESITTQAIADRLGVTHGALFRHFPDKAAIWTAVIDWVRARLGRVIDGAFDAGGSPLAVLERLFYAHVDFVAGHPGVPRILFHELLRPDDSPFQKVARLIVGSYRQRLCALFVQAKQQGQLPASLDEEAAAIHFIGTVQGLVVQGSLFRGKGGMRKAARRIFPLLLDGFRGTKS